jgi:enoyl-CoA hydratase
MLFTATAMSAFDAYRLGMVNQVIERDQLGNVTLALAELIARKPSFSLKLAKEAVNAVEGCPGTILRP